MKQQDLELLPSDSLGSRSRPEYAMADRACVLAGQKQKQNPTLSSYENRPGVSSCLRLSWVGRPGFLQCSPGVIPGRGLTRAGMRPNPTGGMGLWEQLPSALVPEAGFLFCLFFRGLRTPRLNWPCRVWRLLSHQCSLSY